jgi:superfamily II DNA helicase RecQ
MATCDFVSPGASLPDFQRNLKQLDISLIAVDEARVFRVEFRPTIVILARSKNFPAVPVIALTATAC